MSRSPLSRLRILALFSALLVLAQTPAAFAAETFSFENSFQGWTRDHFIDCEQDPEPCDFNWRITRSTEQALDGNRSLKMFLDGTNDDGTIWLERRFDVEPNSTTEVTIRFWLWSEGQSDFNTWPVVAYAGRANPEREDDFTIVGQTDRKAGWARYKLVQQVNSGPGGRVWVAFGFGATWETPRTHYIDSVTVAFN